MQALPFALGNYVTAVARLLRGLALAADARNAGPDERPGLQSELEDVIVWLGARAEDAPMNFLHLLRLLEAERAWALGDLGAAALAFDAARDEVAGRQRPWHRALITERAARFRLARGLQHAGLELLAQARQMYLAWGATAQSRPARHGVSRYCGRQPTCSANPPTEPQIGARRVQYSPPEPSTYLGSCPRRRRSARKQRSKGCTPESSTCSPL